MVKTAVRKPKVVVVGGSFAGLCAIRYLKKNPDLDITLVEPKDYFEYTPGVLHLLAGSEGDLISPLKDIIEDSALIVHGQLYGMNEAPDSKSIIVRLPDVDGVKGALSVIPYDAMIICTGSPYSAPIRSAPILYSTMENRLLEIEEYADKLSNADRVIVAGGGLVGVELAAEISCRLEGRVREVSLISRSTLLNTLPAAAGNFALQWLKKRKNVRVLLGDEIVGEPFTDTSTSTSADAVGGGSNGQRNDTMSYRTKNGEVLQCDLFIDCTGRYMKVSPPTITATDITTSVTASEGESSSDNNNDHKSFIWPFDKNGLIMVDEHLMSIKYPKSGVFAAGDIVEHYPAVGSASTSARSGPFGSLTNTPSVRNAFLAESQAEVCAANVARYLSLSTTTASSSSSSLPQYSTGGMIKYPQGLFGVKECPLLACVSLGPMQGIVIFNNLVLGGVLFGMMGGFVKYVIERSKIAEIRNKTWGRALWAFGHVVTTVLHVLHCRVSNFIRAPFAIFRGSGSSSGSQAQAKLAG